MKKNVFIVVSLLFIFSCQNNSDSNGQKVSNGKDPSVPSNNLAVSSCDEFVQSLGADYMRDQVMVPENYQKPNENLIQVSYFRPKVLASKVVIFFNGGPGGDSHSSYSVLDKTLSDKKLKDQVSVVYLDQRGNGCSTGFPVGSVSDISYLEKLTHYGSIEIVNDAEVIRQKLMGTKPWTVFGQSYGGFLVHRYVSLFPESIVKAISHAGSISLDGFERNKSRITSQVYVWNLFAKEYPAAFDKMKKMKSFLTINKNFCIAYGPKNDSACGLEIMDEAGLMSNLGFNKWDRLSKAFDRYVDAQGVLNQTELKKRLDLGFQEDLPGYGPAMSVINITDRGVGSMYASVCLSIYADASAKLGVNADDYFTECSSSIQLNQEESPRRAALVKTLQPYLRLETAAELRSGILKMQPKSFYIYSGDHDTFVPEGSILPELKFINDLVNYKHFATTGHDGFYTEAEVLQQLVN